MVVDRHAARDAAQEALAPEIARQEAMRLRFARLMPEPECASLAEAITAAQQTIERADALHRERDRFAHELRTESSLLAQAVALTGCGKTSTADLGQFPLATLKARLGSRGIGSRGDARRDLLVRLPTDLAAHTLARSLRPTLAGLRLAQFLLGSRGRGVEIGCRGHDDIGDLGREP